jgi:NAD(P)-dependent dehydrogenase (short-subunit alcohol dehydrogenase family)
VSKGWAGQVVVITGGSSGLGRATALELARQGARLVLAARRVLPLEDAARECERLGASALAVPTDVTDLEAMQRLAARAIEHFGGIDVWINDAGVAATGPFEALPEEVFRRVMETNFEGTVNGVRAVLPHFRTRGAGVIVNVSSLDASLNGPNVTAWSASKHATRGFTSSLREELKGTGIRVIDLMPGAVDTPLWQHAANYSGRVLKPRAPVASPEQTARTLVRAMRGPGRDVSTAGPNPLFAALTAVAPRLVELQMRHALRRLHPGRQAAYDTPGNLFAPMETGTGISGGWRQERWTRASRLAALGLVGAGLLGWLAAHRRRARPGRKLPLSPVH